MLRRCFRLWPGVCATRSAVFWRRRTKTSGASSTIFEGALSLIPRVELPGALTSRLSQRQEMFASRFDPFRLAVEHAVLESTRLAIERKDRGKKPYVSFTRLDEDLAPESSDEQETDQVKTRELLRGPRPRNRHKPNS